MKHEINRAPMAVILAAGIGSRLRPLTDTNAKCLLSVGGSVILERMIRNCLSCGISQFVLVLGYRAEEIKQFVNKTFRGIRVTYVINGRYRETDTGYSLLQAESAIGTSEFIKLDADVVFDPQILRRLVDNDLSNVLCMDRSSALGDERVRVIADDQMNVTEIGKKPVPDSVPGASLGIEKISPETGSLLFAELREMMDNPVRLKDSCAVAYAHLLGRGSVFKALDIAGLKWIEIDTAEDLAAANALFTSPVTTVSRSQQRVLDAEAEPKPQVT